MFGRGVLALCVLAVLAAPGTAQARVAFVGLEGLGLDRTVVEPIEQLLTGELSRVAGGDILAPADVTAALLEPSLARLRRCSGKRPCLIDLGGITEADVVVYGTLTQLGDRYVVQLRGIDVVASRELPRVRETLSGDNDDLVARIRSAATQLLDIDRYKGRLEVDVHPATAEVTIDGENVTVIEGLPLPVPVGQHAVTVAAPGYRTLSALVEVGYDEVARINARLVSIDADFTVEGSSVASRWWPAVAIGAGALSLGLGGWTGYNAAKAELDFKRAYRVNNRSDAWFADKATSGRRYALATNVAVGLGVALVTAGVLGWIFGDSPAAPAPTPTPAP